MNAALFYSLRQEQAGNITKNCFELPGFRTEDATLVFIPDLSHSTLTNKPKPSSFSCPSIYISVGSSAVY